MATEKIILKPMKALSAMLTFYLTIKFEKFQNHFFQHSKKNAITLNTYTLLKTVHTNN